MSFTKAVKEAGAARLSRVANLLIVIVGIGIYAPYQLYIRSEMTGFMAGQFTDVIAGAIIPSVLAAWPGIRKWFELSLRSLFGTLIVTGAAAFSWEVLVPLLDSTSVPDVMDVFAYLLGGAINWLVAAFLLRRKFAVSEENV
ncbi:hypothetical protein [Aurantiacibacter sediminis]|uniref:Uncharacterized protein n=1 Tax=Aurantiacibacter sediminis TaxID=2793064 RepID=A0ABS0MZ72_9SPHN|nr:hypothetical protein [Aurantiacibacter sediminis]MBH5321013.1 hypothetical protein [Aurantiacibacter sediminis]